MSLKFMHKKSWHTGKMSNIEKVWINEQKEEKEQKKLAEFQKQIKEEREIMELRQLQKASGQTVDHIDTSMDWMYKVPNNNDADEKAKLAEEYLLGKVFNPSSKSLSSSPSSSIINNFKTEEKVIEDEIDEGKQQRVDLALMREDPLQIIKQKEFESRKRLLKNSTFESYDYDEKRVEKSHKHKEKKSKKEKKEKKEKKHKKEKRERDDSDDNYHKRSRKNSLDYKRERTKDHHLGPNPELLRRHREKKANEEEERLQKLRPSSHVSNHISRQEREKMRQEMEINAQVYDRLRNQRLQHADRELKADKAQERERYVRDGYSNNDVAFLKDVRKSTYMGSSDNLGERLKQNRHTSIKSHHT